MKRMCKREMKRDGKKEKVKKCKMEMMLNVVVKAAFLKKSKHRSMGTIPNQVFQCNKILLV